MPFWSLSVCVWLGWLSVGMQHVYVHYARQMWFIDGKPCCLRGHQGGRGSRPTCQRFHQITAEIHCCPSNHSGKKKMIKQSKGSVWAWERRVETSIECCTFLNTFQWNVGFCLTVGWLWQEFVALHPTARSSPVSLHAIRWFVLNGMKRWWFLLDLRPANIVLYRPRCRTLFVQPLLNRRPSQNQSHLTFVTLYMLGQCGV